MKEISGFSLLFFLLIVSKSLSAQFDSIDVFPELYGQAAEDALFSAYKPATVLGYGPARDTLFSRILGKNDSLTCVYSGHRVYMDPSEDPTTTVFQNGGTNGINTEHTWPQAYGAGSGAARSNMYHLFPTRILVNSARASFPFAEIPDAETTTWFYLNQSQNNIPNQNIERYSESKQGVFEPREDFKGDIARAMVYFYTVYRNERTDAPADFFSSQIATLYQWHLQDPVDEAEWNRNIQIATYQDDKSNPYILDPSLVSRVFCAELNLLCEPTAINEADPEPTLSLSNSPNPFGSFTQLEYELAEAGQIELTVFDVYGRKVAVLLNQWQGAGKHTFQWEKPGDLLTNGTMIYGRLHWSNGDKKSFAIQRMLHFVR